MKLRLFLTLLIFFGTWGDVFCWQDPNITDMRVGSHHDYTRVVFELKAKLPYRVNRDNRGDIVVEFPSGVVSQKVVSSRGSIVKVRDNLIKDIEIGKVGKGVRATIMLGKDAASFKTALFEKPYRLVIDVRKSDVIPAGVQKKQHRIDVVIIDAGHGGKDPGAIGRRGLREKVVTLDIARRAEKLLRREGKVRVILTRRGDEFVSLDKRVKMANKEMAGLFVSIHANSSHQRSAGGFETFYLGESKTDEARSVAILENSVLELEDGPFLSDIDRTLNKILWDLRLHEFKTESRELAETIQANMDMRLALKNRGVKGALLYVLRGVAMPAVLVESAFISNPREEALLRSGVFRQTVAKAVYESILQYKDRFENTGGFTE